MSIDQEKNHFNFVWTSEMYVHHVPWQIEVSFSVSCICVLLISTRTQYTVPRKQFPFNPSEQIILISFLSGLICNTSPFEYLSVANALGVNLEMLYSCAIVLC